MKPYAELSYDDDAQERINAQLVELEIGHRQQLRAAAKLAGAQLEYLKPSLIGSQRKGALVFGPAAFANRGTFLIVLADARRVSTFHCLADPRRWEQLRADIGALHRKGAWTAEMSAQMMEIVLQGHGAQPGQEAPTRKSPPIPGPAAITGLLAGIDEDGRETLFAAIDSIIVADVCPALIGLVGPGTSGVADQMCCAWPLLMPLAPYAAAYDEEFAEAFQVGD